MIYIILNATAIVLVGTYIKQSEFTCSKLGDNCIQNFRLGMYIVGYTVGNLVISERVSDDIPPQMKNLNMVIPILMHY